MTIILMLDEHPLILTFHLRQSQHLPNPIYNQCILNKHLLRLLTTERLSTLWMPTYIFIKRIIYILSAFGHYDCDDGIFRDSYS